MWTILLLSQALAGPVDIARSHLSPPEALHLEARPLSWAGGTLVRFEQRLHGLPVEGGSLLVSVSPSGEVLRSRGALVPSATAPEPVLSAPTAIELIEDELRLMGVPLSRAPRAELVWRLMDGSPRLAWAIDLGLARSATTLRVWVDARDGTALAGDITSRSARASIYPRSPLHSDPIEVDLLGLYDGEQLSGEYVIARSCDAWVIEPGWLGTTWCEASSPHASPDDDGDFIYIPDPGGLDDPFAEAQIYHQVDFFSAWLDERYGFRLDEPLQATVNFPMANAFFGDFDGDGLAEVSFGQVEETGVDFAYDADVVYHEVGHAVVGALAPDLPFLQADAHGMEWVSGSINEGTADVLSMVHTLSPDLGAYAASGLGRAAIRQLEEDRICPIDLRGEVHADGEILASLGWNMVDDPLIGADATADLLIGAIPAWGNPLAWPDVGASLLDSAADLLEAGALDGAAHDAIVAHVERSGILDCGRVIPLDDGLQPELFMMNAGLHGDLARIPLGVQLSLEVPPEATALRFRVLEMQGHEGMGWTLYGRAGQPVEHSPIGSETLGLSFATASVYDWAVDGEREGEVVLRLDEEPALVPGETLYLALSSRNLGSIEVLDFQWASVKVGASWSSTDAEIAPPHARPEEDRGGCSTLPAGRAASPGWLMGLLLILGSLRAARRAKVAANPMEVTT